MMNGVIEKRKSKLSKAAIDKRLWQEEDLVNLTRDDLVHLLENGMKCRADLKAALKCQTDWKMPCHECSHIARILFGY